MFSHFRWPLKYNCEINGPYPQKYIPPRSQISFGKSEFSIEQAPDLELFGYSYSIPDKENDGSEDEDDPEVVKTEIRFFEKKGPKRSLLRPRRRCFSYYLFSSAHDSKKSKGRQIFVVSVSPATENRFFSS